MDFRFTAHDPQTGDFLHRLPRPEKVQIGDTFGTRGTLDLTYSSRALNAKVMPTFVEIRQEVTFDGGMTWEQIGPNYLRLSGSHEDTDQAGMREVKFVSREWLLSKARVGYGDLPLIDGKRPFYQSSPGTIIRTLLLEAGDRGAAQGIEVGDFTADVDSSGNDWPKVATIYYSPGLPILNVLENLVEQGLCDYRMDGNTMRLYAPETTIGRDLTTGADPVRVHGHVTEAPVNYTLEDLTTSALLIGDDGFEVEVDNPSAPDDYGRLEATIEQGGVSDEGTARVMIDETLQKGSREIREITRTQRVDGLKHVPYRDYRVGDFVQVRDQGAWERYRVREIQLVRDKDGWTAHTVINDRLQELLLKLAKRTSGIVNGSSGSGGDGTPPARPPRPGIEPAAPEGLVVDQQVYLDRQGIARGQITASWSPVTESVRGKAIDIGGYELWWRRNETYAEWTRAVVTTGDNTTVSHSPVVLTDTDGTAMEYQWRVRAVAQESARPGPFSDIVTLTMTQDTTPPPPPSAPVVVTDLRIITVDWDGLDEAGEQMPVDFNHVRVYFASTANMADAEQVGYLTQAGSWNSGSMEPDTPVWVAISAVDNVGNESAMTEAQEVTPRKLVDDDSIRDAIEGIDDAIAEAKVAAIEESVVTAGGVTVHNKTTPPVNAPGDKAHDVWQQWTTLEEGGTLVSAWMHDGSTWVKRDITEVYVPRTNIGEGTFGEMSGSRLSANSVTSRSLLVGATGNVIPWAPAATTAPHEPRYGTILSGEVDPDTGEVMRISGGNQNDGDMRACMVFGTGNTIDGMAGSSVFTSVEPGISYFMSAQMRIDGPHPEGAASVRYEIQYRDGLGTYLGRQYGGTFELSESVTTAVTMPVDTPPTAVFAVVHVHKNFWSSGDLIVRSASLRVRSKATLIEDGAITTDKILANAITAGKIAALAIEADHISANAITADKIKAGAIDGKLITGARIRTAASGRRTELDVEGLRSYDSSGNTVLTTQTSDGSISLKGALRQTSKGITIEVGNNYQRGGPGIQWSDSNIYAYPPGVVYSTQSGDASRMQTLIQGPGVSDGNSYLTLKERGDEFDLSIWKGTGSNRDRWRVGASLEDNWMRVGAADSDGPYMYLARGDGTTGKAELRYRHPSNGGYGAMTIRDRYMWLGTYDSSKNMVSRLWGDHNSTELSAGTRNLYLRGKDNFLDAHGGDLYIRRRNSQGTETWPYMRLDSDGINLLPQGSRNIIMGNVISNKMSDPVTTVVIGNGGIIGTYGSTRRIKEQIETVDSTTYEDKLLSVPVSSWIAKRDIEQSRELAKFRAENPMCPVPKHLGYAPDVPQRNMGMIAEDMHEAGMTNLVGYDDYGRPDTIIRESVGMMLIPIIKRLRDRERDLERRVDALEQQLGATA